MILAFAVTSCNARFIISQALEEDGDGKPTNDQLSLHGTPSQTQINSYLIVERLAPSSNSPISHIYLHPPSESYYILVAQYVAIWIAQSELAISRNLQQTNSPSIIGLQFPILFKTKMRSAVNRPTDAATKEVGHRAKNAQIWSLTRQ